MIRDVGGAVGRNAALKAGEAVIREVNGKCPKNKNGEYCTGFPVIFKVFIFSLCILGEICGVAGKIISETLVKELSKSDEFLINVVLILGTFVFASTLIVFKKFLFYKYTLTKEGLLIKKVFSKQLISYTEFKESTKKWPAIQYKGDIIFIINDKMLKFSYSGLVGGLEFTIVLLNILGIDYISAEKLAERMQNGFVKNTKEEKIAYNERKQYIKSINKR